MENQAISRGCLRPPRLACIRDTGGLNGRKMLRGEACCSRYFHCTLCLRAIRVEYGGALYDPSCGLLAFRAHALRAGQQNRSSCDFWRKGREVLPHVASGVETPNITRIRTIELPNKGTIPATEFTKTLTTPATAQMAVRQ